MRAVAVVAAAGLVVLSLACGGGGASQKELVEFSDHPERFRGKELKAYLIVSNGHGVKSLRDHAGKPVAFHAYAGSAMPKLKIVMPDRADDIPNAGSGDGVMITFTCQEGKADEGNRAVKIVRP